MPIYKYANRDFFKKWSPEMAYILGHIAADGSLVKNKRSAHYLDIQSIDKELLIKVKNIIQSEHKICHKTNSEQNNKLKYQLQIGSKEIFKDLNNLGITPNKTKRISLPKIPGKYFQHFVRGFFDGDGNVYFGRYFSSERNKLRPHLQSGFTSASNKFLDKIKNQLRKLANLTGGSLYFSSDAWRLIYGAYDTKKLFEFIYGDIQTCHYLKKILLF